MNYIINKEADFYIEKLKKHLQDNCFLDTKKDSKKNVFDFFKCGIDYMIDILELNRLELNYEAYGCSIDTESILCFNELDKWNAKIEYVADKYNNIGFFLYICKFELKDFTLNELKKLDIDNIVKHATERTTEYECVKNNNIFKLELNDKITKENLINCIIFYSRIYILLRIKSSEIIENIMFKNTNISNKNDVINW